MEHDEARRLLSDGETSTALQEHLAGCAGCRAYADALDTVLHHAPALVPAAPSDLHRRLLTGIAGAAATTGASASDERSPGSADVGGGSVLPFRGRGAGRMFTAGTAVAAAAAVVAALVWVGRPQGPVEDPAYVLAAAVQRVHGVGATSFRFDIEGSTQLVLPEIVLDATVGIDGQAEVTPGELPELPDVELSLPDLELPSMPELPDVGIALPSPDGLVELPDLPDIGLPSLTLPDVELGELPDIGGYLDALQGRAPALPQPQRELLLERWHLAFELERLGVDLQTQVDVRERIGVDGLALTFDGAGRSDGQRASAYELDWQVTSPGPVSGSVEVVAADGRTFVRTAGSETWLVTSAPLGFHLGGTVVPHDLDDLLDRLAAPGSTARDVGTQTLRGVEVRAIAIGEGPTLITAWIGVEDGLLHRVRFEHRAGSDTGVRLTATTTVDLYDHGAAVEVPVPTDAVPIAQAPLVVLPPFWVDVRGAIDAR